MHGYKSQLHSNRVLVFFTESKFMRVYAYLIVERKGRAEDLEVLSNHEKLIADYAASNSMLIAEWVREREISRLRDLERKPEFNKLIEKLEPGDSIIFPSFGTFTSSPKDALQDSTELIERSIHLHFVDLGGDVYKDHQNLLFKVFETFAKEPVPIKRLRPRTVRRVEDGEEYRGGVLPYGYKLDKKQNQLIEEKWRKDVIRMIAESVIEDLALRPACDKIKNELKVPISIFTIQRLRESEEVQQLVDSIKKSNKKN